MQFIYTFWRHLLKWCFHLLTVQPPEYSWWYCQQFGCTAQYSWGGDKDTIVKTGGHSFTQVWQTNVHVQPSQKKMCHPVQEHPSFWQDIKDSLIVFSGMWLRTYTSPLSPSRTSSTSSPEQMPPKEKPCWSPGRHYNNKKKSIEKTEISSPALTKKHCWCVICSNHSKCKDCNVTTCKLKLGCGSIKV